MRKQYVITMDVHDKNEFERRFTALGNEFQNFIETQENQDVKNMLWGMKRELNSLSKIVE